MSQPASAQQPQSLQQQQPSAATPPRPASTGFGRFMFWFQWITPVLTAAMLAFGRGIFFGQDLGWVTFFMLFLIGPIWLVVHWFGCGLTFIPKYPRRARALPPISGILNLATIPLVFVMAMFVEDATDSTSDTGYQSLAQSAFGLSSDATAIGAMLVFGLVALCFIGYVVAAFIPPKSQR